MSLDELIINRKSRAQLDAYLENPTHTLLLSGIRGVGLGTIAKDLAENIAGPQVLTIAPILHNKQKTANINIDDIRRIHELNGRRRHDKLVIVVDDAEFMTNDAPQAFLKLLEEPTENLFFILTAHETARIPATIKSRAQSIVILPPETETCERLLQTGPLKISSEKRKKITFMAGNRPAEIVRLVGDESYFRVASESFEKAKQFLTGSPLNRLKIIVSYSDRTTAIDMVQNIAKLVSVTADSQSNIKSFPQKMNTISEVIDNLKQNGNLRIQLAFLALNI